MKCKDCVGAAGYPERIADVVSEATVHIEDHNIHLCASHAMSLIDALQEQFEPGVSGENCGAFLAAVQADIDAIKAEAVTPPMAYRKCEYYNGCTSVNTKFCANPPGFFCPQHRIALNASVA